MKLTSTFFGITRPPSSKSPSSKALPFIGLLTALLASSCSSLLYYPSREIAANPTAFGVRYEPFQVQTEDGLKLESWWVQSETKPAKGVIVFFHGNAQNLTAQFPQASWFRHFGYHVLLFDYRGYGVSEGKPSPEGTVTDGKAILREAKKRAGGLPIIAFGQSLGGAVLLRTAIETQNEIPLQGMLLDSTFLSYRHAAQEILSKSWITWPFQWLGLLLISDSWAPSGTDRSFPKIPYYVIHGTNDITVDYSLGRELFERLPENKTLLTIDGGTHTDVFFRNDGNYRKTVVDWLDQTVKR